jgi:serine phosphatase RsbU (regulator of sigma subunit)
MNKPVIRVLLVEDNPGDAVLIRAMLDDAAVGPFEITVVDRLARARRLLDEQDFGIVLLDLSLPDSRGLDTFRGLRRPGPQPPVVVLTGLDDETLAIEAVSEGAQEYLVKGQISGRQLAHALHHAIGRHQRQRRMEERLRATEAELRVAQAIQRALLPRQSPRLDGYDVFGASLSAGAVGGDLFQYLWLPDGTLGLAVADVTGHGIGPALLMVAVRSYLRAFTQTQTDAGRVLTLANRLFAQDVTDGNNCSLFLAKLDTAGRTLGHASAGHHPPGFVLDAGAALKARLYSTGFLLGLQPDAEFTVEPPVALETGDLVLLLTDGVIEAESAAGKRFGIARALDVVRSVREKDANQIVEEIIRAVGEFVGDQPQADDITAVVVKVTR